jgi:pentatricopeptide repeat protein
MKNKIMKRSAVLVLLLQVHTRFVLITLQVVLFSLTECSSSFIITSTTRRNNIKTTNIRRPPSRTHENNVKSRMCIQSKRNPRDFFGNSSNSRISSENQQLPEEEEEEETVSISGMNHNHNRRQRSNTNTRKLEWLLRTTSHIISYPTEEKEKEILFMNHLNKDKNVNTNQNNNRESSPTKMKKKRYNKKLIHPIGTLPSSYITKIPTLMNIWLKRINNNSMINSKSKNRKHQFYYKQHQEHHHESETMSNDKDNNGHNIHSNAAMVIEMLLQRLIDEQNAGNHYFITENTPSSKNTNNGNVDTIRTHNHNDHRHDESMIINTDLYNLAIEGWIKATTTTTNNINNWNDQNNNTVCANHVHSIFQTMIKQQNNCQVQPNIKTCFLVLKAWVRCREDCSLLKMEEIINYLEQQFLLSNSTITIDSDTSTQHTLLLHDYEDDNDDDEIHHNGNHYQYININSSTTMIQCYNMYLYALANYKETKIHDNYTNEKERAEKAHDILQNLKKSINNHDEKQRNRIASVCANANIQPDVNTYNQVLAAYAKTKSIQGASKAQSILDEMMKEANVTNVYPDTNTFNAVMGCWHKSESKNSSFHVEYLLNLMNGLSSSSRSSSKNNIEEGGLGVVSGYSRARPDLFSVNTAIVSIGKSSRKEKLRRAHYILMNMESLYGVKPDAVSYNVVLDAYSKSRDVRAVVETDRLLSTMEKLYMDGNDQVMPDSFSYSTVIDTICSRMKNNAGDKAETIILRMEKLWKEHDGEEPSTIVYNALLNCYASSGESDDIQKLEATLHYMETMSQRGNSNMKPNRITYNTVLKGYAQAKDNFTKKAEDLLDRMETRELGIEPDEISYTTVISAFARSSIPGKARKAKRILDRMIESYLNGSNKSIKMTIYPFNSCLNACAYTFSRNEKMNAFVVVVDTLVEIQKFCKPDHTTYGTVLKSWRNLIPKHDERRQAVVSSSFRQCCKEGLVGQLVIRQLQLATSPEVYFELVGKHPKDNKSSLPSEWSRNVKERRDL